MIDATHSLITWLLLIPIVATSVAYSELFRASTRRSLALAACLALVVFFGALLDSSSPSNSIPVLAPWLEATRISAYCGVLFNFIMCLVFIAFGDRVFATKTAGVWSLIQTLVSIGFITENTLIFAVVIAAAMLCHLKVSQEDVYQVSRKGDRYILVTFSSIVAIAVLLLFFGLLRSVHQINTFSELTSSVASLPRPTKLLGHVLLMIMLGAFPLHFWVKPLFAAPARYGLAVITRLSIGFLVWAKLYPLIFSGDQLLDHALTLGCGANLLYAGFLLFGERKLSQIVSALYLFHVPLLILAVKFSEHEKTPDFMLDFANITVAISGLLIILGMLRDRLGAENLDNASGLGNSYPLIGIAFLFCVLSLVGFPGTLGFISSEIILHHLAESTWPVAVCFIITIALNGYSSFRIFGESFYGDPAKSFRQIFQPLRREKLALAMILLFLFISGVGPQFTEAPLIPPEQQQPALKIAPSPLTP